MVYRKRSVYSFREMKKQKLTTIELFSGIGAQKRGIDNTGLYDLEVVATSDIDKEVMVEYAAIHHGLTTEMVENYKDYPSKEDMAQSLTDRRIGYDFQKNKQYDWFKLAKKKKGMDLEKYWLAAKLTNNLGDVSKIDKLPQCDILTFSSPCTDYSIAGKQEGSFNTCNMCGHKFNPFDYDVEDRYNCPNCGSDDIQGTRSGLLKEVERLLINSIKSGEAPKYLLQENVDALVSKKFKPDFEAFCRRLENLNYSVYWTVLNAKECGVPQNRRRLFMIGIRKDIDTGKFTFPLPFDTGVRLKDILEKNVDERYYINTERASNLIQQLIDKGQLKGQRVCCDMSDNNPNVKDIANVIVSHYDKGISARKAEGTAVVESDKIDNQKRLGGLWDGEKKHQIGSVWDSNGMSPTLDTCAGGGRQPHIIESIEPKERFFKQALETFNRNECEEGDTIDAFNQRVNKSGYCPTLTTRPEGFKTAILPVVKDNEYVYRIRKLTVRECAKLMGFEFSDWDKCSALSISNSAGYRACGNSIVTNCISLLFEHLYQAQYDETYVCTDERMQNFTQPQVAV